MPHFSVLLKNLYASIHVQSYIVLATEVNFTGSVFCTVIFFIIMPPINCYLYHIRECMVYTGNDSLYFSDCQQSFDFFENKIFSVKYKKTKVGKLGLKVMLTRDV